MDTTVAINHILLLINNEDYTPVDHQLQFGGKLQQDEKF